MQPVGGGAMTQTLSVAFHSQDVSDTHAAWSVWLGQPSGGIAPMQTFVTAFH